MIESDITVCLSDEIVLRPDPDGLSLQGRVGTPLPARLEIEHPGWYSYWTDEQWLGLTPGWYVKHGIILDDLDMADALSISVLREGYDVHVVVTDEHTGRVALFERTFDQISMFKIGILLRLSLLAGGLWEFEDRRLSTWPSGGV